MHAHPSLTPRRLSLGWLLMIPLLLLVMWLGTRSLTTAPLWGDEINTIRDARGTDVDPRSPLDVWNGVGSRNPVHVPGYFMLLAGWSAAAGWSDLSVRLLSLLAGLGAVALTYRLGRDLFGGRAGFYAAGLMSTSMLFVHYLFQARMYTLSVFFTVLTVWAYLRIVGAKREPGLLWWLGLLAGTVGLLYTHYIAALVLLPLGLYHVLFVRVGRRWWQVAGVMILAAILFLPWLNLFRAGVETVEDQETLHSGALTAPQVVGWLGYLFGNGQGALTAVVLALAVYAAVRDPNRRRVRRVWLLFVALLAMILIVNGVFAIISDKRARYLLTLWPLLALLGAVGFVQIERRLPQLAALLLAAWLVFGVVQSNSVLMDSALKGYNVIYPLQTAAALVIPHAQPGDLLINDVPDNRPEPGDFSDASDYYFGASAVKSIVSRGAGTFDKNRDLLAASSRIWLAYETGRLPSNLTQLHDQMATLFQHCFDLDGEHQLRAELFVRLSDTCPDGV